MKDSVVELFKNLLTSEDCFEEDLYIWEGFSSMQEVCDCLTHSFEKVKSVVFNFKPDSTAGLDGLNDKFYQACWDTIDPNIYEVVQDFFKGSQELYGKYYSPYS